MPRILFVCTGNTCRSPMAEALFRDMVKARAAQPDEWTVSSAGTDALEGKPISPQARSVLHHQYDLDASGHASRAVSPGLLRRQDLILVMERRHKQRVVEIAPEVRARLYTLREYAEGAGASDVSDPFGGAEERYLEAAREIKRLLDLAWPRLRSWDQGSG